MLATGSGAIIGERMGQKREQEANEIFTFYHDRAVRTFSCFYSCGNPFSETDLYFFRKQ